ncbi:uncharacterized protein J8A68_000903 [[Candida] subhashii]|uniref:COX assembly mitochondrial protein n=1 Tax=[Candida] subhashii TaxID=561895 RepID=A0A8J5QRS7_9ASCO|nr:uncharacterized protein J8A68_000903 [[Candida] subhashii]KAG7665501.1 hypothetical protein J8A68_000903 [[Candida] subhashii]
MSYYPKKKEFEDVELPTDPNMPPWIISPKEEKVIFARWRRKAFAKCDDLIKAYVECSNSYKNPIEGMEKCKAINEKSLACVAKYQKQKYLDIERDLLVEEKKQKRDLYNYYKEKKLKELQLEREAAKKNQEAN